VATYELETIEAGEPGPTALALVGELDLTNASELAERLRELAEVPKLVLDLNRVVFIDSAALHRLFQLARDRQPDGLALVLDPASPIARVVDIVELARVARVATTLEDASRALG
jgi:anti-anti-sigma factor